MKPAVAWNAPVFEWTRIPELTVSLGMVADARTTLEGLAASCVGPGIHPAHACAAVGEVFGRDAGYQADGGNTSPWAALALPSTRP